MKIVERGTVVVIAMLIAMPFVLEVAPSRLDDQTITSSNYSSITDTIYVKGGGNTLKSISQEIGNDAVFYYDDTNGTAYCYSNITIQGWINITSETLFFDDQKKLQINSTAGVNVTRSVIAGMPEEKRWWQGENRYGVHKNASGTLLIENSTIKDTGWGDAQGNRGVEIYGPGLEIRDSVISSGYNGLVFYDSGDMTNSNISNTTFKNMGNVGILLKSGTNHLTVKNSTFNDNWGYDVDHGSSGNITLFNCTTEEYRINSDGYIKEGYFIDLLIKNETAALPNEDVAFSTKDGGSKKTLQTDTSGRLYDVPFIWKIENISSSQRQLFNITTDGVTTYFSPSHYNFLEINTSESDRIYLSNITAEPRSFVPENNQLDPQNITLSAVIHNDGASPYEGNISFFFGEITVARKEISVPSTTEVQITIDWIPDVEGYQKIRAELDHMKSITDDNHQAWSDTFFAGYYNETVVPYGDKTKKTMQMMDWAVQGEDADGYYTIYEDWSQSILMEMGLNYLAAYEFTGNTSYRDRAVKQIDYTLGLRDQWGLFNYSTDYEVRGRYPSTHHEWSTHRNVRSALALQQAYLYTGNETYRDFYDHVIDFILNRVAMENITFHGGVDYTVPWESTEPNGGTGGIKGGSKDFPFVYVNAYVQLGRLLTQAYFDENMNSTYYQNDSLLPHIKTCTRYVINDQIDGDGSEGTWPYFSYYDDKNSGDPWKRRHMYYAALTAMDLGNINVYLRWDNITRALTNYSRYIEDHMTLRSAVDTNNGAYGSIETYVFVRSLYNTTERNVSKIDDFMFSNVFFNDNGTLNWFYLDSDRHFYDPDDYGFIYNHYNPLRTYLWDRYYNELSSQTYDIPLYSGGSSDGWNFISTRLLPNSKTLPSILEDPSFGISGNYDKLMYYSSEGDKWSTYDPDRSHKFNDDIRLDHEMGIWIRMDATDTLTIEGPHPYRTTISLKPGWNMVGYPSNTTRQASDTLPSEITKIGIFNGTNEYNLEYITDLDNATLSAGNGYWLYNSASESVEWTVDY